MENECSKEEKKQFTCVCVFRLAFPRINNSNLALLTQLFFGFIFLFINRYSSSLEYSRSLFGLPNRMSFSFCVFLHTKKKYKKRNLSSSLHTTINDGEQSNLNVYTFRQIIYYSSTFIPIYALNYY